MGFSIASIFDPQSSQQISVFTQFQDLLVLLFFVSLNGHHWFLLALAQSFQLVPPMGASFGAPIAGQLMAGAGRLFAIGVQLAGPVTAAIFLANVVLGLLARTVPQMNVLMVGFSLTIPLGFIVFMLSLPLFLQQAHALFSQMGRDLTLVVRSLSHAF
jgi:flagellar biosynthetic protein FliR